MDRAFGTGKVRLPLRSVVSRAWKHQKYRISRIFSAFVITGVCPPAPACTRLYLPVQEMAEQEGIAEALGRNDPILTNPDDKAALEQELELELENLLREEIGEPAPPTCPSLETPPGNLDVPPLSAKLERPLKRGDLETGANCDRVVRGNADADAGAGARAEESLAPLRGSRPDVQAPVPVPLPS